MVPMRGVYVFVAFLTQHSHRSLVIVDVTVILIRRNMCMMKSDWTKWLVCFAVVKFGAYFNRIKTQQNTHLGQLVCLTLYL